MLYFMTLNVKEEREQNNYKVTFIHGKMIIMITGKCIAFGAYDEVELQKSVICLSVVVQVVQYVKQQHTNRL